MKPFGQWLNDFKSDDTEPPILDVMPEVASDYSEQDPYVAPHPEGCIIARCERCYDEVDPTHFGVRHDLVTRDMHFICDSCMSPQAPRLDGDDEDWRD